MLPLTKFFEIWANQLAKGAVLWKVFVWHFWWDSYCEFNHSYWGYNGYMQAIDWIYNLAGHDFIWCKMLHIIVMEIPSWVARAHGPSKHWMSTRWWYDGRKTNGNDAVKECYIIDRQSQTNEAGWSCLLESFAQHWTSSFRVGILRVLLGMGFGFWYVLIVLLPLKVRIISLSKVWLF